MYCEMIYYDLYIINDLLLFICIIMIYCDSLLVLVSVFLSLSWFVAVAVPRCRQVGVYFSFEGDRTTHQARQCFVISTCVDGACPFV